MSKAFDPHQDGATLRGCAINHSNFLPKESSGEIKYMSIPMLDLRQMLMGDLHKLRYVHRYSTTLLIQKENVAEHSFYVALYSMFIAQWLNEQGYEVEMEKVLLRAIIHDLDESRTGDFQRPFKHKNPELKALIEKASREEFATAISAVIPANTSLAAILVKEWENTKDDSIEGVVIEFADYLSVISHLAGEMACANISVMQHYTTLSDYTGKFADIRYNPVRPLVNETITIFNEMLVKAGISISQGE